MGVSVRYQIGNQIKELILMGASMHAITTLFVTLILPFSACVFLNPRSTEAKAHSHALMAGHNGRSLVQLVLKLISSKRVS